MTRTKACLQRITQGALCLFVLGPSATAWSQQVTVTAPFHNVQDNFFERNGVGFGFNMRGSNPNGPGARVVGLLPNGQFVPNGDIQFRQGGFNAAAPGIGGANNNPGAGAQGGFAVGGRGGEAFFNFAAGQGRTTTHTMQAPMVTTMNGMPGQFSDQVQTPFVTSVTPVVGGFIGGYTTSPAAHARRMPTPRISPLLERVQRLQSGEHAGGSRSSRGKQPADAHDDAPPTARQQFAAAGESTAGQPALSLAEIERRRMAGQEPESQEARELMERGQKAAEAGKPGVAKIFYRQAANAATGPLRDEAERKLRELSSSPSSSSTSSSPGK